MGDLKGENKNKPNENEETDENKVDVDKDNFKGDQHELDKRDEMENKQDAN